MIAYRSRFILESFQRRVGAQVALFGAQTGKLLKRGLHQALRVPLSDLAFGIGMVLGEQTRPVQVQVRIQVLSAEIIDWRSEQHTSELPSLMRTSYAVFCLKNKTN